MIAIALIASDNVAQMLFKAEPGIVGKPVGVGVQSLQETFDFLLCFLRPGGVGKAQNNWAVPLAAHVLLPRVGWYLPVQSAGLAAPTPKQNPVALCKMGGIQRISSQSAM